MGLVDLQIPSRDFFTAGKPNLVASRSVIDGLQPITTTGVSSPDAIQGPESYSASSFTIHGHDHELTISS